MRRRTLAHWGNRALWWCVIFILSACSHTITRPKLNDDKLVIEVMPENEWIRELQQQVDDLRAENAELRHALAHIMELYAKEIER